MTSDMFKVSSPPTHSTQDTLHIQLCPICSVEVPVSERYPNYVCNECLIIHTPVDVSGNDMGFINDTTPDGGFISIANGIIGVDHICWVNGVKCYADRARFGGIVIQPMRD